MDDVDARLLGEVCEFIWSMRSASHPNDRRFTDCGRSCISYGLIQIVRDVISCSFFSIFVSSFNCAARC